MVHFGNNIVLNSLAKFLIPFILLYGFFYLTKFEQFGFFAVIYAIILFVIAFLLYSMIISNFFDVKLPVKFLSVFACGCFFVYFLVIAFYLTKFSLA